MATRFRKSVNLGGGVKLNINKKSVGISAGVKGARVSANSSGRKTVTTGIPGTGLYNTKTISSSKQVDGEPDETEFDRAPASRDNPAYVFLLTFFGVILIILSALIALVMPPVGIVGILLGVLLICYGNRIKKRIRESNSNL